MTENRRTKIPPRRFWLLMVHCGFGLCWCRAENDTMRSSPPPIFPIQRVPVPRHLKPETNITIIPASSDYVPTNGRTLQVLTSTEDFRVIVPPENHQLQKTSKQSTASNCHYAANGGPFHADGTCAGAVIVDDANIVSNDFGSVGLGRTKDDRMWIIGPVASDKQAILDLDLRYYVTGFDWLVYNGKNVASQFNNTTGADQAPRTAVGLTVAGVLVLVVADGCQCCLHRRGLTLEQLADQMLRADAAFAINMDGGSSSVLVESTHGVISRPTCLDFFAIQCERPVASVLCVGHQRPTFLQDSVLF